MTSLDATIAAARAALARGDLMTAKMAAPQLARAGGRSYDAQITLGEVLSRLRQLGPAQTAFAAAARLRPLALEPRLKLGAALLMQSRAPEAETEFRRAVALKRDDPEAWLSLAKALHTQKRLDEAIEAGREAVRLGPDRSENLQFLGTSLGDAGLLDEAVEHLRAAADLPRFNPGAASNYLMALNYREHDPDWVCAEHVRRMDGVLDALGEEAARAPAWANTPDPERRLTVAILSPDLHGHVCMRFMLPVIEGLDRERFRLVAYANITRPDAITERIRPCFDLWRDVINAGGPMIARQARLDGVDILIECAGHTNAARLDACAWHAAPVQCTWLGYPNTTGLRRIGWRIVDGVSDPQGRSESHCVERLLRVNPCAWCYRPSDSMPDVAPPPVASSGTFTFGSFNNLAKITPAVARAWGAVLARAPGARLILKDRWKDSPRSIGWLLDAVVAAGARRDQIEVIGFAPAADFLATYAKVDLQLDPFPYNGTTTTCESLWMGVPVLTVEGRWHAARVGTSLLTAAGLVEFIAPSVEGYIEKAAALARDPAPLVALRATMRDRVAASPLRDEPRYCRAFESALRSAWRDWCAARSAG